MAGPSARLDPVARDPEVTSRQRDRLDGDLGTANEIFYLLNFLAGRAARVPRPRRAPRRRRVPPPGSSARA